MAINKTWIKPDQPGAEAIKAAMTFYDKCLPQKRFDGLIQFQQGFLDIFFQAVTVSNFAHSPIGSAEIK